MLEKNLRKHLDPYLREEQKGCRTHMYGTLHHLVTARVIAEEKRKAKESYSNAYLDFAKAFDSMSHEWILSTLKAYRVDPRCTGLIRRLMQQWVISLTVQGKKISADIR
jgi:hypothetical protein